MIVMGGIVGSGIFMNPSVVAKQVHTPFLILGVWLAGGALAMLGAFIWAELATRLPGRRRPISLPARGLPSVGGVCVWLGTAAGHADRRDGRSRRDLRALLPRDQRLSAWSDSAIAAAVLLGLTAINCLGARAGSNVQSALMLMKTGAIAALVIAGVGPRRRRPFTHCRCWTGRYRSACWARSARGMIPVAFAYGGWQTATFVAGEMRNPGARPFARPGGRRHRRGGALPRGQLGLPQGARAGGLAATRTPASAVMRAALGERGALWIALGIAISTLGFLSQGMLTAPRVYNAMARDGLFFERVGRLSPRTGAPVTAIVLQGIAATAIAFSGKYEQILNYEVSVDFISFALTGGALFVFRRAGARRSRRAASTARPAIRTPPRCSSLPARRLSPAP